MPPTPHKHVGDDDDDQAAGAPKQRFYLVQAGDTFGVISGKTGVPAATIARLNPKVSLDLALHRREDPAQVRRPLLLSPSLAAALLAARTGARPPMPPPVRARAWLVEDARTGEVLASSNAARAACRSHRSRS